MHKGVGQGHVNGLAQCYINDVTTSIVTTIWAFFLTHTIYTAQKNKGNTKITHPRSE
jgi:hypothetical protein